MSCYESERGTLQFTKTGYMQVVRAFRPAFNAYVDSVYQLALIAHTKLSAITGAKCSEKRKETFSIWSCTQRHLNFDRTSRMSDYRSDGQRVDEILLQLVESELFRGKGGTLTKPRRSAFPKLINTQVNFDVAVSFDGHLRFSQNANGTGQIFWKVDENNRAVDDAHSSPVYRLFAKVLNDYKWKRGEGGAFYHDDEYARDGAEESGSCYQSSISHTWGPEGKAEQERRTNAMFAAAGFTRKRPRVKRK